MARRTRKRKVVVFTLVVLAALLAAGGVGAYTFLTKDEGVVYANVVDQYKYGSVGTEQEQGVPYEVWVVLPDVFPDLLPRGTGTGWERLGFIYEQDRVTPIGTTYRDKPIGLVGLNCAVCHTGTYRESTGDFASHRARHAGQPLSHVGLHPVPAEGGARRQVQRRHDPRRSRETLSRQAVAPRADLLPLRGVPGDAEGARRAGRRLRVARQPAPVRAGRVDTFNPLKQRAGIDMTNERVGTVDFPSVWEQRERKGMYLHWDGNNNSLLERNFSAARAVGGTDESMDVDQLNRIADWLLDLPAPKYPLSRINQPLAQRGESLYGQHCASCHDVGGDKVGRVTPIGELGTDPERMRSFTPELIKELHKVGKGRPWHFRHFRKTNGYANLLLDGIWLRAPYLHNGSVPNLRALLFPEERPDSFYIGYDVYDWKNVGFVTSGLAAQIEGFRYDTTLSGNSNSGHLYGTKLPPAERLAIIEYLKTR